MITIRDMTWWGIDERLPSDDRTVLFSFIQTGKMKISVGSFMDSYFFDDVKGWKMNLDQVKYWMLLPPLPVDYVKNEVIEGDGFETLYESYGGFNPFETCPCNIAGFIPVKWVINSSCPK